MTWNGRPASPRQHFLDFLGEWETTLPLQSLWMLFFDIPPAVQEAAMTYYGERHIAQDWGVNVAKRRLSDEGSFYNGYGCAFAQTVGVPAEQVGMEQVGIGNRGFLKMPIIQQRQPFPALNIEFLETSLSFGDFLLRPWVILASHMGLVKRYNPLERITTDMFLLNLTRAGTNFESDAQGNLKNTQGFLARKMWLFKDCVPVNIGAERYSYTVGADVDRRETEWSYRKYQVMIPPTLPETFDSINTKANQEGQARQFWAGHKLRHKSPKKGKDLIEATNDESRKYWWGTKLHENSAFAGGLASAANNTERAKAVADKYWGANKTPDTTTPAGVIGTDGAGDVDYDTGHDLNKGAPIGVIGTGGAGGVDYNTGDDLKGQKPPATKPKYKTGHDLK
jgi:hypothetical protein